MPQVQVLPEVPSFGGELAKVLGQAATDIGTGFINRREKRLFEEELGRLGENPSLQDILRLQQKAPKGKESLIGTILAKRGQGLTPYQKISTKQREDERDRKTKNSIQDMFFKLSDITKGANVSPSDIPYLTNKMSKEVLENGKDTTQASDDIMNQYTQETQAIKDISIPKYNSKKVAEDIKAVAQQLKQSNIQTPRKIRVLLTNKKYPGSVINNILKQMEAKPITPELAQHFLDQANDDNKKARILAEEAGYSF